MLEGIRVVEVEGIGPGPFAGMTLADLGAEVIVVHRPGGGGLDGMPDRPIVDRGKRAITLDLKDAGDREVFLDLVKTADALIEGFRPGVMERLGLGPEHCRAVRPQLVYGRMTGWGQEGPLSHAAGHDMNYISLAGALWHASLPGQPPITPPTLVGDIGGGALYLVIGILSGVLNARRTGQGTVVDAAIYDGAAHMLNLLMMMNQTGRFNPQRGQSLLDGPHWSRTYATSDGGFMSVQCLEPKFYAVFLEKLGLDQDSMFSAQYDPALWPELSEKLGGIFASRTRAEWTELFEGTDACVAPVLTPHEAQEHSISKARGTWTEAGGVLQAAPAPRFDGATRDIGRVPSRGEDSEEILAELERR